MIANLKVSQDKEFGRRNYVTLQGQTRCTEAKITFIWICLNVFYTESFSESKP